LEFLLVAVESADPPPPELEGAVLELISEKHCNYYLIKDSKQNQVDLWRQTQRETMMTMMMGLKEGEEREEIRVVVWRRWVGLYYCVWFL
jgi:hypothetical protein